MAALAYGAVLIWQVLGKPQGDEKMREIARAIQEGASAYLTRQYKTVFIVGVVAVLILWKWLGGMLALGFVIGAVASALAGFVGMMVAVRANVRVAEAAHQDFLSENLSGQALHQRRLKNAFGLAYKGGAVTGLWLAWRCCR